VIPSCFCSAGSGDGQPEKAQIVSHRADQLYGANNMVRILKFPVPLRAVSATRDREAALSRLLPKFLGVLWDLGEPGHLPGSVVAIVNEKLEIGGSPIDGVRFVAHAYVKVEPQKFVKVFSAHLAPVGGGDPMFFQRWGGRCGLLSWRRGPWEDVISEYPIPPRTMAHVITAGLARPKRAS
jgi:hypothetical protein